MLLEFIVLSVIGIVFFYNRLAYLEMGEDKSHT